MTNFGVKGVLWRRVLKATIDTLLDNSPGQFHIALTTNALIPVAGLRDARNLALAGDLGRGMFFRFSPRWGPLPCAL